MVWEVLVGGLLVLVVVAGLVYWTYYVPVYNELVELQEDIEQAASNIEVLLQRRQDELNRLSIAVREATGHEANTLNEVISAREAMDGAAEGVQAGQPRLADVDVRSEEYPEIAAIRNIDQLQENIVAIERELAEQREAYNGIVTEYNKRVQAIPRAVVARRGGFEPRQQFEASTTRLAGEGIGLETAIQADTERMAGVGDPPLSGEAGSERALDAAEPQESADDR